MTVPSPDRWIFHITHLRNLPSILARGHLLCDSATGQEGALDTDIGMPSIKARRRTTKVTCGAGGAPADYVPFYFGPRSPMLYSISRGNVPTYGEGQDPVVYLATTVAVIRTAGLRSVFTEGNAGAAFVQFHEDGPLLESSIDWPLMGERYWNDTPDDPGRANRRQAEYLVHQAVPVGVIRMLAARTEARAAQVRGIALQFKQAFPDNYRAYRQACQRGEVVVGKMFVFDTQRLGSPRFVINFPTKRHWRSPSRLSDVRAGLVDLVEVVQAHGITSIAVPALGCGNGGLDWSEVRPLIVNAFAQRPEIAVALFPPTGSPSPAQMPIATPRPSMTLGRAAVVTLILGYVAQARTERVEASDGASLLEIQKLMYLFQLLGRPMRLAYAKGRYGPYAEGLNHQLQAMEGHFIRGYGDRSQRVLDLQPIVVLPDVEAETNAWIQHNSPGLHRQVREVLDFIDGFASPYGLELLTTVHWAANHETDEQSSAAALLAAVRAWNQRKATLFTEAHLGAAYDRLTERSLVAARPS